MQITIAAGNIFSFFIIICRNNKTDISYESSAWQTITWNGKKGKRKVQVVPQSQTTALPRHQEEEETDKTKQTQIEQTYEKLLD